MTAAKPRILLVEDHQLVASTLAVILRDYEVTVAPNAVLAEDHLRQQNFDIAILDLMLPESKRGGLDLIKQWRGQGFRFPIIVYSGTTWDDAAHTCIEAGADDFVRKPSKMRELKARIQRLLERSMQSTAPMAPRRTDGIMLPAGSFDFAGASVSPDLTVLFKDGAKEPILAKQFGLLQLFAASRGRLLLREEVVKHVWGPAVNVHGRSIDEYISRLRKLFAAHGTDFNAAVVAEKKSGWRVLE